MPIKYCGLRMRLMIVPFVLRSYKLYSMDVIIYILW